LIGDDERSGATRSDAAAGDKLFNASSLVQPAMSSTDAVVICLLWYGDEIPDCGPASSKATLTRYPLNYNRPPDYELPAF